MLEADNSEFYELNATMRKATGLGSKRGSRKKHAPPNNDGGAREPREERPYVAPPTEQPPPEMIPIHRRKPTAEEAALTSKNYRLAKELVRRTYCF
jgi:hypothetical protein